MAYHAHHIHVTKEQAKKLARGQSIRLAHKHIKGGHLVKLTKRQLVKLAKAHKAGKGASLRMSMVQLRHNRKHGAGFFSDLAKKGVQLAVNKGLPALANLGVAKLQNAINNKIAAPQGGSGFFDSLLSGVGSVAQQAAPLLIQAGLSKLAGVGIKGAKAKHSKKGHKKSKSGGSFSAAGY